MHYITTSIIHYRYDGVHRNQAVRIHFYKLLRSIDAYEMTCLTYEETTKLINFLVHQKDNFGDKNYHSCESVVLVDPSLETQESVENPAVPKYLILKKDPQASHHSKKILPAMEIELLNTLGEKIDPSYSLDFEVIGEIMGQS